MIRRTVLLGLLAANLAAAQTATTAPSHAIRDIWFTGNHKLSTRALSETIGLRAGDACTQAALDAAMSRIVAAYKAIGSDLALSVDVTLPDPSHNNVNFIIDESGSGGIQGAALRSGARMRGAPPPPSPATRQ